jgi:hypothetical protein
MQVPEIPLDFIAPGLKVKLTYEGPVRNPTSAALAFFYEEQVKKKEKKGEPTEREKFRAETARIAEDQAKFREGLKTPEQRAAEHEQFWNAYWGSKNRLGLNPIKIPGLVEEENVSALKMRNARPKRKEEGLQRKAEGSKPLAGIPPVVHEVLKSPGQPLEPGIRAFMEQRFRHDFSLVRVHTDAKAIESARAVNAKAYTIGRNMVFGAGYYEPGISTGQRLLAHELAHVVQQTSTGQTLQRDAGTSAAPAVVRQNLVILLEESLIAEAATLAPGAPIISAKNPEELATKLKAISTPIKTLFIISHSLNTGDLGFKDGEFTSFVPPSQVAIKLQGAIATDKAPELVDFRGCSVGSAPPAMDKIREALGAGSAVGGNCFIVTSEQGPIEIEGKKITTRSQVNKNNRPTFEQGLQMLSDVFGKAKGCILDSTEDAYFRTGGKFVAQWFSPVMSTEWDPLHSRCYTSITPEVVDPTKVTSASPGITSRCRIIKVEKKSGSTTP